MKKLAIFLFSLFFLTLSSPLNYSKANSIRSYKSYDNYSLIDSVTGEELDFRPYSTLDTIQIYLAATSEMKKMLAQNGYDISSINILLYYANPSVKADTPRKQWNSMQDKQTVLSPWLKLFKTISSSGATEVTIHIDAREARLIMDLFPTSNDRTMEKNFLQVDHIDGNCFKTVREDYVSLAHHSSENIPEEVPASFACLSEPLRQPVFSLFTSSNQIFVIPFTSSINQRLKECQYIAQEYYTELYQNLVIQALQILSSESKPEPMWWAEVVEHVQREDRDMCKRNLSSK